MALGRAYVVCCAWRTAVPQRTISPAEIAAERARFDAAVGKAEVELAALQQDVRDRIGASEAQILDVQGLLLQEKTLRERVFRAIEEERLNVEGVVSGVLDEYVRTLQTVGDGNLRERAADVLDVRRRLLSFLAEEGGWGSPQVPDGAIVVSDELLPSVTARFELDRIRGFVTRA